MHYYNSLIRQSLGCILSVLSKNFENQELPDDICIHILQNSLPFIQETLLKFTKEKSVIVQTNPKNTPDKEQEVFTEQKQPDLKQPVFTEQSQPDLTEQKRIRSILRSVNIARLRRRIKLLHKQIPNSDSKNEQTRCIQRKQPQSLKKKKMLRNIESYKQNYQSRNQLKL